MSTADILTIFAISCTACLCWGHALAKRNEYARVEAAKRQILHNANQYMDAMYAEVQKTKRQLRELKRDIKNGDTWKHQ